MIESKVSDNVNIQEFVIIQCEYINCKKVKNVN